MSEAKTLTADQLEKALQNMDPGELAAFQDRSGSRLNVAVRDSKPQARRYGYRCESCTYLGLVFTGDRWNDPDGSPRANPPTNVAIEDLLWVQDGLDEHGKDLVPGGGGHRGPKPGQRRALPHCQYCHSQLAVEGQHGHLRHDRVMTIKAWRSVQKWRTARRGSSGRYAHNRDKKRVDHVRYEEEGRTVALTEPK